MWGEPEWWLPLSSYQAMARRHCEDMQAAGWKLTFRGARRVYRHARNGMMFLVPGTMTPKS